MILFELSDISHISELPENTEIRSKDTQEEFIVIKLGSQYALAVNKSEILNIKDFKKVTVAK